MLTIDLQNDNNFFGVPSLQEFEDWVSASLQSKYDQLEQSIRIVDKAESQTLNSSYRNSHEPTNVLSFPMSDEELLPYQCLGDLVVCQPVVVQQAKDQNKPEQAHWAHLIIHGMLHLQGYDHNNDAEAAIMESLEIKILSTLGFSNPYTINVKKQSTITNI